jgi:hypothetical protein
MFQRLCKGAIQITKTAVYGDVDQTPIFSLCFETVVMFKNRVEISKIDNVKSLEEINYKINNLQEEIRSSKKHIRWYRDLVHKMFCLHVYKGKEKISSMIYIEMAKVNFGEATEVTADQVAWLSLDFQILQYHLAKYRGAIRSDKDFEKKCSRLKINSVLENALETPSKVYVLAFLGKSYDFVKGNLDVYKLLKASEKGYYCKPALPTDLLGTKASKLGEMQAEGHSGDQEEPRSQKSKSSPPTDDEMRENKYSAKIVASGSKKRTLKTGKTSSKDQQTFGAHEEREMGEHLVNFRSTQKKVKSKLQASRDLRRARVGSGNQVGTEESEQVSEQSQESSEDVDFNQLQSSKEKTKTQSKLQTSSKSSKPRPRVNDDRTTARLKSVHLQDMKKSAIAANKSDYDDSDDSFVGHIFDKVNGYMKKPLKDEPLLAELDKMGKPVRAKVGGAPRRLKTTDGRGDDPALDGDEDERFNLPKGKLVAMLSRLEMKDLQMTQEVESNRAELDTLKQDMLKLALKTQTLKTNYKGAKPKIYSLENENNRLIDENNSLNIQVETLSKEKTRALTTIEELQGALDSTRLELR